MPQKEQNGMRYRVTIGLDPGWSKTGGFGIAAYDGETDTCINVTDWSPSGDLAPDAQSLRKAITDMGLPGDRWCIEDQTPAMIGAMRFGRFRSENLNVLYGFGVSLAVMDPDTTAIVSPLDVRKALGLPRDAKKQAVWNALTIGDVRGRCPKNEHQRDALALAKLDQLRLRGRI